MTIAFERAIEAVARRLCEEQHHDPDGFSKTAPAAKNWMFLRYRAEPIVRAALEAIRVPDEGMIAAGVPAAEYSAAMPGNGPQDARDTYRAMIDHLLSFCPKA